jgi:hypothetical protein
MWIGLRSAVLSNRKMKSGLLKGLLCLCLCSGVAAKTSRLEQVGRAFQEAALVECELLHHFHWTLTDEDLQLRGRLLACADGRFRMDLASTHVLSDGESVWRWEDGGFQVLQEARATSDIVLFPQDILLNPHEHFRIMKQTEMGKDTLRFSLEPRVPNDFMQNLTLDVIATRKTTRPHALRFSDFGGNQHQYILQGLNYHETLADSMDRLLVFVQPSGFELIRMEGASH